MPVGQEKVMIHKGNLVIVGGGIAGVSAAEAARAEYPHARIAILGREPYPFYNRIAVGALASGKKPASDMHFYPPGWLDEQRIEAIWGEDVIDLIPEKKLLLTTGKREMTYDRLILATGALPSRPDIPGIESDGVVSLWTMDDALRVSSLLDGVGAVLIVGGGVLGVEAALDMAAAGKDVTLVEYGDGLMPLNLGAPPASMLRSFLESRGITVRLSCAVRGISRGKKSLVASTSDGAGLEADLILVTTGVLPDVALSRRAGLDVRRGVVVDDHMFTSEPDILACGNCCEIESRLDMLWSPARSQGQCAGANAFERRSALVRQPSILHLKSNEMPLFICDGPASGGDIRIAEDAGAKRYRAVGLDGDGRIVSAVMAGDISGFYMLEKAIRVGLRVPVDTLDIGVSQVMDAIGTQLEDDPPSPNVWACRMCGFTHEGPLPPGICPVCSVGRDQFLAA